MLQKLAPVLSKMGSGYNSFTNEVLGEGGCVIGTIIPPDLEGSSVSYQMEFVTSLDQFYRDTSVDITNLHWAAGGGVRFKTIIGTLRFDVGVRLNRLAAMEAKGGMYGAYYVPDRHTLYAAQTLTQQLYPKVLNTLRDLAGGGMIMLPSSVADFANPEIAGLIERTQQSPAASATERVKFYKLAWDAVGSEFASRHQQYEMFYAGATFVTKGHSFRTYDWNAAGALVDQMLGSYSLDDEIKPAQAAA